ncbi:MAG: outer membrane protein OmpK [Mariprofundales bacterium]
MLFNSRHWLGRCLAVLLLLPATAALAEGFSSTNVQLLGGSNFHDPFFGYNTVDGRMTTLTLEHFGTWAYGDNFFFVDLLSGTFVDFAGKRSGKTTRVYGEWHSRLSLSRLSGHDLGIALIKDWFIAGQINRDGEGFKANMVGLGTNLDIPGFQFLELDAYVRKDNFNRRTWQLSTAWSLPLYRDLLTLDGYVDVNGTNNNGTEINGQPQLLLDVGQVFGVKGGLQAGVEWYLHRHRFLHSSVPQAMVKWSF